MRSKGGWDSPLPDWGQIIAIEHRLMYFNPLSNFKRVALAKAVKDKARVVVKKTKVATKTKFVI